jgi:hypothetical protein
MEERSLSTRPSAALPGRPTSQTNLADILERVLDKGIVIAGDIQINLLDVELLTIKLRLLIASVDRAREMGINWWESDASLQGAGSDRELEPGQLERENRELRERLERLERQLGVGNGDPGESSRQGSRASNG